MLRRQTMIALLAAFAGAMVLLLMLDDPTAVGNSDLGSVRLFPQLSLAEHIERIEVQDVTTGTGFLLVRDEAGVWYAALMPRSIQGPSADLIDQAAVDVLALSIVRLTTGQWYEATPENLVRFGLRPEPAYRLQFTGRDASGRAFESAVFEVGDVNPDRVAHYVWPQDGQQVYLLIINYLLEMLPVTPQPAPTSASEPVVATDAAPVP